MPVPEEFKLSNKTAIVTGNGRGWTATLASALAEAGADVAIVASHSQDIDEALQATRAYGRNVLGINADLTKASEVNGMMEEVASKLGMVDILVNNAQVEFGKPFMEVSEAEWRRVMDLNVNSLFLCCQAAGSKMLEQGWGRIVNITSVLATRGLWNSVAYCASQGAAQQITQALGIEWARTPVRVNGIGAGWFTTEQISQEEALKDPLVRYLPSRRMGHPRDICGLLLYLSSDACEFITGQTIFIDGGALAHA